MTPGRVALCPKMQKPLEIKTFWRRKKVADFLSKSTTLFGGGGGSRTPVRKQIPTGISGCSLWSTFPPLQVHRQTHSISSFIGHV
jgi:hypothetical protein